MNRCDKMKGSKMIGFALNLKDCIFPNVIIPISTSHLPQHPSTSLCPENCPKTAIFLQIYLHVACPQLQKTHDTPYARPFSSPSNRAYCVSLRPSVVAQSTQDRSGAAPFFDPVNFPALLVITSGSRSAERSSFSNDGQI